MAQANSLWTVLATSASDFSATAMNSLANGSTSGAMSYDNSTNTDLYLYLLLTTNSITTAAGAYALIRYYMTIAGQAEDISGDGESRSRNLIVGTGAKNVVFRMQAPPCPLRFTMSNFSGVAWGTCTLKAIAGSERSLDV